MSDIDTDTEPSLVDEWRRLLARHAAVTGAVEHELQQRHGIGVNEFEALERLVEGADGCRALELTDALPLSQSAASRLVARLERQGLVTRTVCVNDRRGVFVCLTEAGRERYLAARPTQRAVLAATMRPESSG
ncbi:MAG TPA: MarR family transcriptional regulator [Streptosporangiaceae bacterium]|nr:MarR family transcriptional regulator [Streptosporangiaceae bacterium]